jgi:hypothetical protein
LSELLADGGSQLLGTFSSPIPGYLGVIGEPPFLVVSAETGVYLLDGGSFEQLSDQETRKPVHVSGEWISFTKPSGAMLLDQIWVRAPNGQLTQRTFSDPPPTVEALSASGDLIVRDAANISRQLIPAQGAEVDLGAPYAQGLPVPPYGYYGLPLGSPSFQSSGAQVFVANAILTVVPDADEVTADCPAPQEDGGSEEPGSPGGASAKPCSCGAGGGEVLAALSLVLLVRRRWGIRAARRARY